MSSTENLLRHLDFSALEIGKDVLIMADEFCAHDLALLAPDGVLIFSAQNRLGIKYWAGAADDSTHLIYESVTNFPSRERPASFSRAEYLTLLRDQGFDTIHEYYPFPNHLTPSSVLSARLVALNPMLAAELAAGQVFQNEGMPRFQSFPDLLGLKSVAKAGLFTEFANSFTFVAARSADSPTLRKLLDKSRTHQEVGWHFSGGRVAATQTIFFENTMGTSPTSVDVSKIALTPPKHHLEIKWTPLAKRPVLQGQTLTDVFARLCYSQEWHALIGELEKFLDWSFQKWTIPQDVRLQGEALDALFINTFKTPSSYELFDLEWTHKSPIDPSWFIFRNVFAFIRNFDLFSDTAPFISFRELYELLCKNAGINAQFTADLKKEARFQMWVSGDQDPEKHEKDLEKNMEFPFRPSLFPRDPWKECVMRAEYPALKRIAQSLSVRLLKKFFPFGL